MRKGERVLNILWLTLESLWPVDTAGKIGVYKRLENVCKKHDVYLFYFTDSDRSTDTELSGVCKEIKGFQRVKSKIQLLKNYIHLPYTVSTRVSEELTNEIDSCIIENHIDLINIDFPQMCYSLLKCKNLANVKIVLNQHNIEWQRFEEISKSESITWMRKLISVLESVRLKKYEELIYSKIHFDGMTFVTQDDIDIFKQWIEVHPYYLKLVPGGAESHFISKPNITNHNHSIIFVGVMSNELNPEGALWFINKVWPKIKKEVPEVQFFVVGKDPVEKLKRITEPDIHVTGYVEDLKKYYEMADFVVIPVQHGGGVKLKLLEAIGYGKVVVTTSVGARGTKFEHGVDIIIEDDPEAFADYCIDILNNCEKYSMLKKNAEKKFRDEYTWEGISDRYIEFLETIISR